MTILGNVLLGIAALVFLLFKIDTFGKTPPGGDAAVGWAWAVLITNAITFICLVLVALIIGVKGGFAWVPTTGIGRFLWVVVGLGMALFGLIFINFREGLRMPMWLGEVLSMALTVLLIAGFAILLNGGKAYRLPLLLAVGLGAVPCGLVFFGYLKNKVERNIARMKAAGQPDSNDLRMIGEIEAHDTAKNGISRLLIFTDRHKDKSVREPALAKIKSYPNWQQQLAEGLRRPWTSEVFTFLSSNDPDDKNLFAEPLHDGIRMTAADVRETLGRASQDHHLYEGQFWWEVERVLLTLKKFEGNGQNYRPVMQELRAAFDARSSVKKPKFHCIRELDKWLKTH